MPVIIAGLVFLYVKFSKISDRDIVRFSPWGQSSPMWAIHTLILSEEIEDYSIGSHDCIQKLRVSLQKD